MSNTRNKKPLARRAGLPSAFLLTLLMTDTVVAGSVRPQNTAAVETMTFQMPACPIAAQTVSPTKIPLQLVAENPLGDGATITGTVQVTDQTGGTVLLISPVVTVTQTQLSFSRTIRTLQHATGQVTYDKGCSRTDPFGSNNCRWDWGQSITDAHQGALQEDITSGKLSVNLKIDTLHKVQFTCPVCGSPCTVSSKGWFLRGRWQGAVSLTLDLLQNYPGFDWWIPNQY